MLELLCIVILVLLILAILWGSSQNQISYTYMSPQEIDGLNVSNDNVYVSFTTIPSRLDHIPEVIERLKEQTFKPTMIYIGIPEFSKRKQVPYEIPENWDLPDNVKIVRCEDYGPATKLLGALSEINDPESIIITIDDDQIYSTDAIKTLVAYAELYPDHCVCSKGFGYSFGSVQARVPVLEGFGAVAYRRKFITDEMISYFSQTLPHEVFVSDDLIISAWLRMNNIPILKITNNIRLRDGETSNINPLYKEDRERCYTVTNKHLATLENYRHFISTKSYYYVADKYDGESKQLNTQLNWDRFRDLKDHDIVCLRSCWLPDFVKLFKTSKAHIILITIDSYYTVPTDLWPSLNEFHTFLADPRLIHWFSSNVPDEYLSDKLSILPIGIDYHTASLHPYAQEQELKTLSKSLPPLSDRPLKVLGNYHLVNSSKSRKGLHGEDRTDIYNRLKSNGCIDHYTTKQSRTYYWKDHGNYSFILSPHGIGLDCHRTWEALILGCIVIVKRGVFNALYNDLPVIIVDDWNELTEENLKIWKAQVLKTTYNWDKLTMDYWKDLIVSKKLTY